MTSESYVMIGVAVATVMGVVVIPTIADIRRGRRQMREIETRRIANERMVEAHREAMRQQQAAIEAAEFRRRMMWPVATTAEGRPWTPHLDIYDDLVSGGMAAAAPAPEPGPPAPQIPLDDLVKKLESKDRTLHWLRGGK